MTAHKSPNNYSIFLRKALALAFFAAIPLPCLADAPANRWDEIVGKRVYNRKGERLGHVSGAAVDIENGRYVGMLVSFGGVLSIGQTTKALPPNVLVDDGKPETLYLDMDKEKFQNAPTFEMSDKVGPPDPKTVAEVYRFYGKTPYFENGIQRPLRKFTASMEKLPILKTAKNPSATSSSPPISFVCRWKTSKVSGWAMSSD